MITHSYSKSVNVCGDILRIHWTGNVWTTPHNGMQYGRDTEAMRALLRTYFRDCGFDPDDEQYAAEIEEYVGSMSIDEESDDE